MQRLRISAGCSSVAVACVNVAYNKVASCFILRGASGVLVAVEMSLVAVRTEGSWEGVADEIDAKVVERIREDIRCSIAGLLTWFEFS